MGFFSEANAFVKIIETICGVFKIKSKKHHKTKAYYYEEYNKKVYVKTNGDGVIVSHVRLHINNPTEASGFVRTFDISDAKPSTVLPDFNTMIQNGNSNPFSQFGIWYWSDSDIVTDLLEHYDDEDKRKIKDNKFLSFKVSLNEAALKKGKDYEIIFAISVPGLYPIENGRFSGTVQEHKDYGKYESSLCIHNTDKLSYSIYMQQGIVFSKTPTAICKNKTDRQPKKSECSYQNNMFYEKFSFTLEKPEEYDKIYMEWDIKNQMPTNG